MNTVGGFVAILLWSATFGLARSLSEQVGAFTAAAAVYLTGGAFCLMTFWRGARHAPRAWPAKRYLLGCGSLFAFYSAAIYLAVGMAADRGQVLEVALINYLWPSATIVLSLPLLGNHARVWLVPGTLAALTGVVLVMTQGTELSWALFLTRLRSNAAAYALAFAAAISWALYSNLARRWSTAESRGAVELFVPVTGLALLVIRFLRVETTHWTLLAVGQVAAMGLITAVAYVLWESAMRKGNLVLVVTASYFTPLLSTLVSCAILDVSPGPQLWVGSVLLYTTS